MVLYILSLQDHHQYEAIDAHVIVFSVTDRGSFRYAEARLREIKADPMHNTLVTILVANKEDLVRNRVISEDGECQCLTNDGICYCKQS